ncbi:MAG: tetratricopeptide repeat protein [Alphaproteobacteria bacterium]
MQIMLTEAFAAHQAGDFVKAELLYRQILALDPKHFDALHMLGVLKQQQKNYSEAQQLIARAIETEPNALEALSNYGAVLRALNRPEEALSQYDAVLAIRPDYVDALNNRGNALQALNRHEEAVESYNAALLLRPDYFDALYNRGTALQALKRHEEAVADLDRALAVNPRHLAALYNRGTALLMLDRREEAIKDLEHLLDIDPDYKYVRGRLLYSRMHCCAWDSFETDAARLMEDMRSGKPSGAPFEFQSVSQSPADLLRCSQIFVHDRYPTSASPIWRGERYQHDKIRVAYLTADFRDQATAYLTAGLFERHDRERFEIVAVSFGADAPGEMRTRLKAAFDRFINVRQMSDRDVARLLHEMEVDIAVDLMGFYGDSRPGIFALRPAPVQVNYLGYPGTIGSDYMDYIIADRWVIPADHQRHYVEKIAYLPDSYQVNDSKRRISEHTPSRADSGLPESGFVFCSFNNTYKITPALFDLWMRLLRQVESSVLWLLAGTRAAPANLRRAAAKRGIDPGRLVFAPRMKLDDHLARHRLGDLFLDTLPYNAHTTASDALWAGLPVITCIGSTFAGRVAASLLDAARLPELITRSLDDYEALALMLARDRNALAATKAKLAANRDTCPLFDTDRFRRHIESAYLTMWERYQRGEAPVGFSVPAISSKGIGAVSVPIGGGAIPG